MPKTPLFDVPRHTPPVYIESAPPPPPGFRLEYVEKSPNSKKALKYKNKNKNVCSWKFVPWFLSDVLSSIHSFKCLNVFITWRKYFNKCEICWKCPRPDRIQIEFNYKYFNHIISQYRHWTWLYRLKTLTKNWLMLIKGNKTFHQDLS